MRGRTKIVIAALIVAAGYVAFKDDIAKLWENLHVRIAEYPQPKKTVWLDQGISQGKTQLVLPRRPGHADLRHAL